MFAYFLRVAGYACDCVAAVEEFEGEMGAAEAAATEYGDLHVKN